MAEAMALLGVVAAGVQCAQAGMQLLILASSLRSKLQEAPEKVKGWLGQIEQLIALADWMKQTELEPSLSSFRLLLPQYESSGRSAVTWVEAALRDCTNQAQALQDILNDMLQEVNNRTGEKLWKTLLTIKRERSITEALYGIERQKSMLNIWLGQNNLRQLDSIHHTVRDVQDGVKGVGQNMLHVEQTLRDEFQNLSIAFHSNSKATASSFEGLKVLGISTVDSLRQQMQQSHGELKAQSSALLLRLHDLEHEMGTVKHEVRELRTLRAEVSRPPSLLKENVQEQTKLETSCGNTRNISRNRGIKWRSSVRPQVCSCHASSRSGYWNFGANFQLSLTRRNMHATNCPAHANMNNYSAEMCCHIQSTILANLVRLSFQATYCNGGFTIGMLLQPHRRVYEHPLESFFLDLYHKRFDKRGSWKVSRYDDKAQDALVRVAQRQLLTTFNSGVASPNDVDRNGQTLLHLQIDYSRTSSGRKYRMCVQIVKLLISMGVKTDSLDTRFRTALQILLESQYLLERTGYRDSISVLNGDILEWTGIKPSQSMNGALMIDCMRRWPESKEGKSQVVNCSSHNTELTPIKIIILSDFLINSEVDGGMFGTLFHLLKKLALKRRDYHINWGYPFICDILLRKSKADLQSFISRGMKPVEETPRRLTPLHLAAAANWPEAVSLLLAAKADKYAQDSSLCLPIDFALYCERLDVVELFLEGDCVPQFTTARREHQFTTIPWHMMCALFSDNESIRNILLHTLVRLRHSLGALRPFHDLAIWPPWEEPKSVVLAERLFLGGFHDLELQNQYGKTALMTACSNGCRGIAKFLIERGANPSTPHRDSALTAGYFLAASSFFSSFAADTKLCASLLDSAFNVTGAVDSHCLCSPEGFTPITALRRSYSSNKRRDFRTLIFCLQWPVCAVEEQTRAFALGEVFDRLQMTHTCVDIHKLSKQIAEENRLEIQSEEEEFNDQLEQLMEEFDSGRVQFSGGPLEFLDFFFRTHEVDLPLDKRSASYNWNDKDILGPGRDYQSIRNSFTGEEIFYGHTEEVKEENMLALIFR